MGWAWSDDDDEGDDRHDGEDDDAQAPLLAEVERSRNQTHPKDNFVPKFSSLGDGEAPEG